MGLYDGYRLSNSTVIPQYVGSALPELANMYEMAQQRYDVASALDQTTADTVLQTPILNQDKATWEAINSDVQAGLRKRTEQDDYENTYRDVQRKAREVAPKLKALTDQVRAQQAYNQSLEDKELGLDLWTKQALQTKSADAYKGIKFDQFGRAIGGFQGIAAAKNIDVDKAIRDNLSILTATSSENIRKGDNGWQRYDTRDGWQAITPDKVKQAYYNGKANDLDWQARDKQQVELRSYMATRGLTNEAAQAIIDSSNLTPAKELISQGYSPKEAYTLYHATKEAANIEQTQLDYALAKAYRQDTHTRDFGVGQLALDSVKRQWEKEDSYNPFIIQGPDTKLTADEQNPEKVRSKNTELADQKATIATEIQRYENQLKGAGITPEQKVQLQSNIDNAKSRLANVSQALNRNEQIMNYVKNKTAQEMGYTGYDQLAKSATDKLLPMVKNAFPNGITGTDGTKISAEELVKAIIEDKYKVTTGRGYNTKLTDASIITSDGKKVNINSSNTIEALQVLAQTSRNNEAVKLGDFEKRFNTNYTSNIKDFSIKSEVIGLSKKHSDEITEVVKAAKGGIEFSEPGQFSNIGESDRPANFRVLAVSPRGVGSNVTLKVEVLDEKNQPTGVYMDAKTSDSNIGEKLGQLWESSGTPDAKRAAQAIRHNSGARMVHNMAVGEKIPLGTMQDGKTDTEVTLQSIRNPDNTVTYKLYDGNGNVRKSTESAITAGMWIDKITGNDNPPPYAQPKRTIKTTTTTKRTY